MAKSTMALSGILVFILVTSYNMYWRIGIISSLFVVMVCIFGMSFWAFSALEDNADE